MQEAREEVLSFIGVLAAEAKSGQKPCPEGFGPHSKRWYMLQTYEIPRQHEEKWATRSVSAKNTVCDVETVATCRGDLRSHVKPSLFSGMGIGTTSGPVAGLRRNAPGETSCTLWAMKWWQGDPEALGCGPDAAFADGWLAGWPP